MIFGRHTDREQPDRKVDVDVHLEEDITLVQTATDAFLNNPEEGRWQALLSVPARLDRRTAASDAYERNVVGSAVFEHADEGSVIGETSQNPISMEVPSRLFQAQLALVKAVKVAVTDPNPKALQTVTTASAALTATQDQS